jgi:hypothetical protein
MVSDNLDAIQAQEVNEQCLPYSGEPIEGLAIQGIMNPDSMEIDINKSFTLEAELLASAVARPDLNGVRLKGPASPAIYVVIDGYRRWIPDPATYNNLFRDWNGIIVVSNLPDIAEAEPLSSGAVLARPAGMAPVYLVSNGVKRHITAPSVMDKYYFDWSKVQSLAVSVVNSIRTGPSISS